MNTSDIDRIIMPELRSVSLPIGWFREKAIYETPDRF